jgi:hypothetical protein
MDAIAATAGGSNVHYTDVFSISESDIPAVNSIVPDFVAELRKKIRQSGAESAHAVCCDFFQFGSLGL